MIKELALISSLFIVVLAPATAQQTNVQIENFTLETETPSLGAWTWSPFSLKNTGDTAETVWIRFNTTTQDCQWTQNYKPGIYFGNYTTRIYYPEKGVQYEIGAGEVFRRPVRTRLDEIGFFNPDYPCPGAYDIELIVDTDSEDDPELTEERSFNAVKLEVEYGDGRNVTVGEKLPWYENLSSGETVSTNFTMEWVAPNPPGYMNLSFKGTGNDPIEPSWVTFCGFDIDLSNATEETCISGDNKTKVDMGYNESGTVNITVPEDEPSGNKTGTVIFEEDPIPVPTTMEVEGGNPGKAPISTPPVNTPRKESKGIPAAIKSILP